MSWQVWEEALSKKNPEAFTNFFNCLRERSNAESRVSSKPYIMYLDPMGYCNLKCPFCPTGNGSNSREKKKLSLATFQHLIDHLGPYLFKLHLYNWGEPLLNKEFPQMVKYAKKYHAVTEISTNLSFPISKEYAEEIVSSGLDVMLCSIDGASQETYQKYRVGGDYELTMKNIKLLKDVKKEKNLETPYIIWRFLVFRHNQHEIGMARKKAKELDVEITFLRPYVKHAEWGSTLPEFSPLISIKTKKKNSVNSDFSKTLSIPEPKNKKENNVGSLNEEVSKTQIDKPKPCTWLWSSITINANGFVSPCCAILKQEDDFGNVDDSIMKVWNNEKYQSARKIFSGKQENVKTVCHNCPVPHIQQEMREFDEMIIRHLLRILSSSERSKIRSLLRKSDKELFMKTIDVYESSWIFKKILKKTQNLIFKQ